jgi:hypothetical protein
MPNHRHWTNNSPLHAVDAKIASDTRKLIEQSLALLQEGPPDTFLGRETHAPFPKETTKWQQLIRTRRR